MNLLFFILITLIVVIILYILLKNKNNKKIQKNLKTNKEPEKIELKQIDDKQKRIGDYIVIKFLGEGATSKVFLVKKDNSLFALKQLNIIDDELKKDFTEK
jgi:predicted membrane protein